MTLLLLLDLRAYPLHSHQVCDCCLFFAVCYFSRKTFRTMASAIPPTMVSTCPRLAVLSVPVDDHVNLVLVLGCAKQDPSASTATGGPSGEGAGGGGGGGGSLGDRVARYGRVLLITAVVAFKIVEWWNRVESQVRGWTGHVCIVVVVVIVVGGSGGGGGVIVLLRCTWVGDGFVTLQSLHFVSLVLFVALVWNTVKVCGLFCTVEEVYAIDPFAKQSLRHSFTSTSHRNSSTGAPRIPNALRPTSAAIYRST